VEKEGIRNFVTVSKNIHYGHTIKNLNNVFRKICTRDIEIFWFYVEKFININNIL